LVEPNLFTDPTRKPPETYTLIENFCLGLRRLELFGRKHSLRPGWVTVGDGIVPDRPSTPQNDQGEVSTGPMPIETDESQPRLWDAQWWDAQVRIDGKNVVPNTPGEYDVIRVHYLSTSALLLLLMTNFAVAVRRDRNATSEITKS
jgi:hypothetical protein